MLIPFFALSLIPVLISHASPACSASSWSLVGKMESEVKEYDEFVSHLLKQKDRSREINERIRSRGLLVAAGSTGETLGFPNHLEGDSPSGKMIGLFLRKLDVPKNSHLTLDVVYEVSSLKSHHVLRQWNLPYESAQFQGIDQDRLLYEHSLSPVCEGSALKVVMSVTPDHHFEAVDVDISKFEKPKLVSPCASAKSIFKKSSYAVCGEFYDVKTRKKRILVWQQPMT